MKEGYRIGRPTVRGNAFSARAQHSSRYGLADCDSADSWFTSPPTHAFTELDEHTECRSDYATTTLMNSCGRKYIFFNVICGDARRCSPCAKLENIITGHVCQFSAFMHFPWLAQSIFFERKMIAKRVRAVGSPLMPVCTNNLLIFVLFRYLG